MENLNNIKEPVNSSGQIDLRVSPPLSLVTNEDCMKMMSRYSDKFFELAVVDPPYEIKDWNKRGSNGKLYAGNSADKLKEWDKKPSAEYWKELFRVSLNQIVWGANHFIEYLQNTKATLIWDKNNVGMHFNNYELAWVSGIKEANRIFRMSTAQITETQIHPTQKPLKLYEWIFNNYAERGQKILDTHLGSGSSRIAAYKAKLDFYGCELDKDYYEAQEARFKKFVSQLTLW
jgi:site-specific DNA-methyltransferase (adenine-specific)